MNHNYKNGPKCERNSPDRRSTEPAAAVSERGAATCGDPRPYHRRTNRHLSGDQPQRRHGACRSRITISRGSCSRISSAIHRSAVIPPAQQQRSPSKKPRRAREGATDVSEGPWIRPPVSSWLPDVPFPAHCARKGCPTGRLCAVLTNPA